MIEIKTLSDINKSKMIHHELGKEFWDYIENYYRGIMGYYIEEDVSEEDFSLAQTGHIVIFLRNDNLEEAFKVGLNREDNGLLGACFEYVNKAPLEELWYEALVLYDNEYSISFIIQSGIDQKLDKYLKEYLCE